MIVTDLSNSFNPVPKETQQRNKQSSAKNAEKKVTGLAAGMI